MGSKWITNWCHKTIYYNSILWLLIHYIIVTLCKYSSLWYIQYIFVIHKALDNLLININKIQILFTNNKYSKALKVQNCIPSKKHAKTVNYALISLSQRTGSKYLKLVEIYFTPFNSINHWSVKMYLNLQTVLNWTPVI